MKELSVEEKAKRYDELKVKAQELTEDGYIDKLTLLDLFPELKESEDERIRKSISAYFAKFKPNDMWNADFSFGDIVVWLEKQGEQPKKHDVCDTCEEKASCVNPCPIKLVEQKPTDVKTTGYWNVQDVEIPFGAKNSKLQEATYYIPKGFHAEIEGNNVVIKKGEKPIAWSEEDEYYLNSCITKIEIDIQNWEGHGKIMIEGDKDLIAWLKSLKDRVLPQPKQEWSEEDEKMLDGIIEASIHHCYLNITDINWLKSLRPLWKPSDEQMEALSKAIAFVFDSNSDVKHSLESLYNELKKL